MKQEIRPAIGAKMYAVHEHLYYIPTRTGPILEYSVCMAEVRGFFTGRFTEVKLVGKNPNGFMTPYYYRLSEIGKKVFYTPREAALRAKEMTDQYERIWGWLGSPDIPMRRSWKHLLENKCRVNFESQEGI